MPNEEQNQTPYDGMPVTICFINDRYAGKIVSVRSTRVEVTYDYAPDMVPEVFTLRNDGKWRYIGKTSPVLRLGVAETYLSPDI